jgi:hypothetical protein
MRSLSKTPAKIQIAGWSSALFVPATLVEVVVVTTVEGAQLAIHAMPMRSRFRRLFDA